MALIEPRISFAGGHTILRLRHGESHRVTHTKSIESDILILGQLDSAVANMTHSFSLEPDFSGFFVHGSASLEYSLTELEVLRRPPEA